MIPSGTLGRLREFESGCRSAIPAAECERLLSLAVQEALSVRVAEELDSRMRSLADLGEMLVGRYGIRGRGVFAAALVSTLALRRAEALRDSSLPPSVLEIIPAAYERLIRNLGAMNPAEYWLGDDGFLKDLRFAAGLTVPCGAQDVDLYARVTARSLIRAALAFGESRNALKVLRLGLAPWFRIHTDSRYLDEFDESGWERCYRRIAEMLARSPGARGMVGTSWFYDAQVRKVSPRLSYLQREPLVHGAILLCHGSSTVDTERAIAKSATRRQLYEAGTYVPVCYSLLWPRRSLMAWAEQQTRVGI